MTKTSGNEVQSLLKNLRRQFGDEALQWFGDSGASSIPTIPSGSLMLDRALGGGFPVGRVVEIFGQESSGKTTLCLHALAECQRVGKLGAVVDVEHALDISYASRIGVDLKKLIVSQPNCGEDALRIAEALVCSGDVGLVVVDSVAALTPRAEIEGEIGDQHMGLQARMMSQALRKLTAVAHQHECILIFVNQIRMKIGVVFGSPETTPGGNALKFFSSLRIKTRRGAPVKRGDQAVGVQLHARVMKNKVAPPFREASFVLDYSSGIQRYSEILELGLEQGVVERSGAWYSVKDQKLGQGRERAAEALERHPDICSLIIRSEKGHDVTPTESPLTALSA